MSIFSCKDTAGLASESLDRSLPVGGRLALHFHLLMCRDCSRFHRQLLFVDEAARRFAEQADHGHTEQFRLSAAARERLKSAFEQSNP
jgi:hypothetical protein